jgi:hypothetical protein
MLSPDIDGTRVRLDPRFKNVEAAALLAAVPGNFVPSWRWLFKYHMLGLAWCATRLRTSGVNISGNDYWLIHDNTADMDRFRSFAVFDDAPYGAPPAPPKWVQLLRTASLAFAEDYFRMGGMDVDDIIANGWGSFNASEPRNHFFQYVTISDCKITEGALVARCNWREPPPPAIPFYEDPGGEAHIVALAAPLAFEFLTHELFGEKTPLSFLRVRRGVDAAELAPGWREVCRTAYAARIPRLPRNHPGRSTYGTIWAETPPKKHRYDAVVARGVY